MEFPSQLMFFEDSAELTESLVDVLEQGFRNQFLDTFTTPIGLATGNTMIPIYKSLVSRLEAWPFSDKEQLSQSWCSFNLDEYVGLDKKNIASFRSYMSKYVAKPLHLNEEAIRLPDGNAQDPVKEANSYSKELSSLGGIGIQLLGLGENGHIGFNEPPCGPEQVCRVVTLSETTRRQNSTSFQGDQNKVPTHAITLGLSEILQAREIHLVVTGASKSKILQELLSRPASNSLPASWLRLHSNVYLWTDKKAFKDSM